MLNLKAPVFPFLLAAGLFASSCAGGGGGGDPSDQTPPTIISSSPSNREEMVVPSAPLSVTFSEPMKRSTFPTDSFTVSGPAGKVAGVVSYDKETFSATFTPDEPLDPYSSYTVSVNMLGAEDVNGNDYAGPPHGWIFRTAGEPVVTVSLNSSGYQVNSDAACNTISGDGKFVVFGSAGTFIPDYSGNLYLYNVEEKTLTGLPSGGPYDDVAMSEDASVIVYGGSNNYYLYKRSSATFINDVFRQTALGGAEPNGFFYSPSLSADGRYLAFSSDSTNFVADDTNGVADVFILDLQTKAVSRLSVTETGVQANSECFMPRLSADGKVVAFISTSTTLYPAQFARHRLFIKEVDTGAFKGVSLDSEYPPDALDLTSDGRHVLYTGKSPGLAAGAFYPLPYNGGNIYSTLLFDRETDEWELISKLDEDSALSSDTYDAVITPDGRYVAYSGSSQNYGEAHQIFIYDRETQTRRVVSKVLSGQIFASACNEPSISSDGRLVVYNSRSSGIYKRVYLADAKQM